jgi:type IV pilus assembly protein PilQ
MSMKKNKLLSALCLRGAMSVLMSSCLVLSLFYSKVTFPAATSDNIFQAQPSNHGTISFYFQDISVKTLLQLIAKNSGLNFIISESIKGNMTLNLKNVTWQQALAIVLRSQGLAASREGNVVIISTLEEMTSHQAKQMQSDQELLNLSPLGSVIISLKYTIANDVATMLKGQQGSLLTSRGQVAVDSRTNSIIIRDIPSNLADLTRAIRQLDIPAKQVLIEARIVSIDINYEKTIGMKFGLTRPQHLSGTLGGANQLQQGVSPANVPIDNIGPPVNSSRLNFNVPAAASLFSATPGTIGLALARLGGNLIDLELSALEGEGHVNIISTPRVITSNQQPAMIQTGEEIPYQEATSSGATSVEFKKAVLSLEITPQITPDNKIILKLRVTHDKRGTQLQSPSGTILPPSIDTQRVDSNVILRDNQTVVIGGVYKEDRESTVTRIPFLGTLPLVGALFRSTDVRNVRNELLIFITPKIIKTGGLALNKKGLSNDYKDADEHA